MQRDPIGFGGRQANLYVYVGNDPVNRVDPRGQFGLQDVFDYYDAWRAARARYSEESIHNGKGDAYAHCMASCLIAQHSGSGLAEFLGELNEIRGDLLHDQPPAERQMDEHNNACGRSYADDDADCSLACFSAAESGELETLR
jgi:hypothetical protein